MQSPDLKRILVFDSGMGGFSIVSEICAANLSIEIYYLADTYCFPYGLKSDLELIERIPKILVEAVNKIKPEAVVIACNTASTIALGQIRDALNIPVIGVVPAVKPAAQISKTKKIGLLATPRTVGSAYVLNLIDEFGNGCEFFRFGPPHLALAAENKLRGEKLNENAFKDSIDGLFQQTGAREIDTIILACTHYPLVREELEKYVPHHVEWVDSGKAIAKRISQVLNLQIGMGQAKLAKAFSTGGDDSGFLASAKKFGFAVAKKI